MKTFFKKMIWLSLASLTLNLSLPAALAEPAPAQLSQLQNYLNGIKTLKANFTQTNPDRTLTNGIMFIKRLANSMGKLRLQYAPPSQDLIVADGEVLRHVDGQSQEVNEYSIENTPASFLLRPNIDFSDDLEVKKMETIGDKINLTLRRSGDNSVTLTLVFVTSPMLRLQEWSLIDAQSNKTHVVLDHVQIGTPIDDKLFKL
jgi:outer membrane lipoprotein-sorting protein